MLPLGLAWVSALPQCCLPGSLAVIWQRLKAANCGCLEHLGEGEGEEIG